MDFEETHLETIQGYDELPINVHIWEPAETNIVLVATHGGLSHAGDYVLPAKFFMNHKITIVAHDLRGHRRKKVKPYPFTDFVEDLDSVVEYTKQRYLGKPIFLLGHSVGATITIRTMIERYANDSEIRGCIISSPYFENALKTPWIAKKLAGVLAFVVPNMKTPAEDLVPYLTRDEQINKRILRDIEAQERTEIPSIGFANQLLKSFGWIKKNINLLSKPTLALLAGSDKIADVAVTQERLLQVDPSIIEIKLYEDNFHENLNELNREEIYQEMLDWIVKVQGN